jgi:hypothetical protein
MFIITNYLLYSCFDIMSNRKHSSPLHSEWDEQLPLQANSLVSLSLSSLIHKKEGISNSTFEKGLKIGYLRCTIYPQNKASSE